ncbi:peptidoglycan-binding protein [Streptomyces sp. G44]|uniref:peptidoglycan-binding domain-containing protein n=1 Tax=Streptomyces sp. G44 TaxID=2807632 RepID=UPI001960567F|nr:peptidoglycan-binding domain-containing protein [Streptomyces sp. G44]MBM7168697.1 peptidoglycan-binding protein [Streptomyces sp. G44]
MSSTRTPRNVHRTRWAAALPLSVLAVLAVASAPAHAVPGSAAASPTVTAAVPGDGGDAGVALRPGAATTLPEATAPSVREIQTLLRRCGYDVPVDGVGGPRLTQAIRRFQHDHGLPVDGIVGPATLAALRACGGAGPA